MTKLFLFQFSMLVASLMAVLSPFQQMVADEGSLSVDVGVDTTDESSEQAFSVPHHYMEVSGGFDALGTAHFAKKGLRHEKLRFAIGNIGGRYLQFLGSQRQFAATIALEYIENLLDWKENDRFSQTNFHNLALNVGGLYQGETWLWKANIGASFDLDAGCIGRYTLYSTQLWGRYSMNELLGLHVGVIAVTGLHENRAWPIIGFDYVWRERWKIKCIYPLDISCFYMFNCNWSLGVVHRFFWVRHRIKPSKVQNAALVEYRNSGTELALRYEYDPIFSLTAHVGYAHGGDLCISPTHSCRDERHLGKPKVRAYQHYDFCGSGYIGGQFSVKF